MKKIDSFIIRGLLFILWLINDKPEEDRKLTIIRLDIKLPATWKDFVFGYMLPFVIITSFVVWICTIIFI